MNNLPPVIIGLNQALKQIQDRFFMTERPKRHAYHKGTVQISVNRQHNGIDYSDIPVEVEVIDVTTNRGETDDPQAEPCYYVELGWAFVTETTGPFNAGKSIELRDDEEEAAREQFIEDKLG